jgi:hypothetical protein
MVDLLKKMILAGATELMKGMPTHTLPTSSMEKEALIDGYQDSPCLLSFYERLTVY